MAGTTNIATDATAAQYSKAYLAAQPKAVQELMAMPGGMNRVNMAAQLAEKGYLIDSTIMVQAWDAYQTMKSRIQFGYTWVPSYLQPPIQEAPGDTQPGGPPPYDAAIMPAGSLLVTLDMNLLPKLFPAPKGA
jgi:hypothetical protein